MEKKELLAKLNEQGIPFTESTLRTYSGGKYKLVQPLERNVGKSNVYVEQQVDILAEIFTSNRLGVPLTEMKVYLKSPQKSEYLREILAKKKEEILEKQSQFKKMLNMIEYVEKNKDISLDARTLYMKFLKE